MPLLKIACPECGAKLSSKAGFTAGQEVQCPKCDEVFAVSRKKPPVVLEDEDERPVKKTKKPVAVEDDEDEDDERPRKKKKTGQSKSSGGGYATSPLRFVILGVLVVTMLVMGYFLYRKLTAPPLPDIIVPAKTQPGED